MGNNAIEDFMICNLHSSQGRGTEGCWEAQFAPRHRESIGAPNSGQWCEIAVGQQPAFNQSLVIYAS
jgi:hypothetical protein